MPFDPTKPAASSEILSAELREQFNGLKDLIDTVPVGPPGPPGPPGEVTQAALDAAIATSALNANLNALEIVVGNPPTTADVEAVINKLNDLILALRQ